MTLSARINLMATLGKLLQDFLVGKENTVFCKELEQKLLEAEQNNSWFTQENLTYCLTYWSQVLTQENLTQWISNKEATNKNKTVAIILAGNIPLVGFHDLLCVFLFGYKAQIKLSSKDKVLIPFLINELIAIEPKTKEFISFLEKLTNYDAVIATGSNNTARYFDYYFKDKPTIIRKNKTSVAVISGEETKEELEKLSNDVFLYFGLGCRNVTKLYMPKGYDLKNIFEAFYHKNPIQHHHKYANNYTYHKAIYLMNLDKIFDNNFLLLKEDTSLYSPISCLFYEEYEQIDALESILIKRKEEIQTVVAKTNTFKNLATIDFGTTQAPRLFDYADGVDTLKFLAEL